MGFKKMELLELTYVSPALENCTVIFYGENNVLGI
jgi:hypothetical protein